MARLGFGAERPLDPKAELEAEDAWLCADDGRYVPRLGFGAKRPYDPEAEDEDETEDARCNTDDGSADLACVGHIRPDGTTVTIEEIAVMMSEHRRRSAAAPRRTEVCVPTPTKPTATALPTVYQHGERSYSVGDGLPVTVGYEEDKLLTAFGSRQKAMSRADLEKVHGISNAPRAMKRLTDRYDGMFTHAIRRPKKKGRGGYFVKVEPFA